MRKIITVASVGWCIFIVLHVVLTGKVYLWNVPSSLPTFLFVLVPIFLLGIHFLIKKREKVYVVLLIFSLLLGTTQVDGNFIRRNQDQEVSDWKSIKVFNWNTNCWDQNKDRKKFYSFLKQQKADIYILQEYLYTTDFGTDVTKEDIMKDKLFSLCPVISGFPACYQTVEDIDALEREFIGYHVAVQNQFVIISKFPVKNSYLDESAQYAVWDVEIGGRVVRFFNVHMLLHVEPISPFGTYFYGMLRRRFQARELAFHNLIEDTKNLKGSYFISGDFNATKAMGVMNEVMKGKIDTAKYSNEWIPTTLKFSGLKLWRFDYAFIPKKNENIRVKSYKSIDHRGLSDHNPLEVILYMNELR